MFHEDVKEDQDVAARAPARTHTRADEPDSSGEFSELVLALLTLLMILDLVRSGLPNVDHRQAHQRQVWTAITMRPESSRDRPGDLLPVAATRQQTVD